MYIEINGIKYPCKFENTTTQLGKSLIRIISNAPVAEDGFKLFDDNNELLFDRSDYKYLYREDGTTIKEYSKTEEYIIPTKNFTSSIPENLMQKQIITLNNKVKALTPYTDSKTAYYGENEKIFYNVPEGNVSVFFDNYNGEYSINRIEDRLVVSFNTLTDTTNINISIL